MNITNLKFNSKYETSSSDILYRPSISEVTSVMFKNIEELLESYIINDLNIRGVVSTHSKYLQLVTIYLNDDTYIAYTAENIPSSYSLREEINTKALNMYKKMKRIYKIKKLLDI